MAVRRLFPFLCRFHTPKKFKQMSHRACCDTDFLVSSKFALGFVCQAESFQLSHALIPKLVFCFLFVHPVVCVSLSVTSADRYRQRKGFDRTLFFPFFPNSAKGVAWRADLFDFQTLSNRYLNIIYRCLFVLPESSSGHPVVDPLSVPRRAPRAFSLH